MTLNESMEYQCRLCMGKDNFQLNIFREDLLQKEILVKIRTCLPIKVERGDGLPNTICYKCLAELDCSYELWNRSFNSEAILKHNLNTGVRSSIKNKFGNTICTPNPDKLQHTHNEDSLLDSLDEKIWTSDNSQLSYERYPNSNNNHVRLNPNPEKTTIDNLDLFSDQDLSELDEMSQRKDWVSMTSFKDNEKFSADTNSETPEKNAGIQRGQKNFMKSSGAPWLEKSGAIINDKTDTTNRYANKNLFMTQSVNDHVRLESQSDDECRKAIPSNYCDKEINRRRTKFPWQKFTGGLSEKKFKQNGELSPEIKKGNGNYSKGISVESNSQENEISEFLFDLNHCPKCNKTLTPSQNLLSHIQSHKE